MTKDDKLTEAKELLRKSVSDLRKSIDRAVVLSALGDRMEALEKEGFPLDSIKSSMSTPDEKDVSLEDTLSSFKSTVGEIMDSIKGTEFNPSEARTDDLDRRADEHEDLKKLRKELNEEEDKKSEKSIQDSAIYNAEVHGDQEPEDKDAWMNELQETRRRQIKEEKEKE